MKEQKGLFISLEGGDGSGKSTALKQIAKILQKKGYKTITTKEPGATTTGAEIRKLILNSNLDMTQNCETFLFLADRAEHIKKVIKPALKENFIVICDRFTDSTLVYQSINSNNPEEKQKELKTLNLYASDIQPDLTLLFDGDVEKFAQRRSKRNIDDRYEQQEIEFHQKVRQSFLTLQKSESQRIKLVNAEADIQQVVNDCIELIMQKINEN